MIECITHPVDGLPFYIPSTPNLVTDDLRAGRQWEPALSAIYPLAASADRWTIEVGAYCGEHTVELLRLGRVAAFEPQPVPFACLTLNCTLRSPDGWETSRRLLYDGTLARLTRVVHVEYGDSHPSYDYVPAVLPEEPTAEVSRPLDEIWPLNRPVAFLKIDAQGCDLPILKGAERLVAAEQPVILCEFEPALAAQHGHAADDYRGWFSRLGYHPPLGLSGTNLLSVHQSRPIAPFRQALEATGLVLT